MQFNKWQCKMALEILTDPKWSKKRDCIFEPSGDGPDARRVSGASDCSGPRSGADNRAALAAKRPIPPRVAGRNPVVRGATESRTSPPRCSNS